MDIVAAKKMTREGAMKVLVAAVDRAHALNCHVSIAVVDDGGHLIAFTRSEKAELYSIALAQAKAKSAALTRFPSGKKSPTGNERDDHHALAITLAAGPGSFVTIEGGFPIFSDGEIVGAVGVSGAARQGYRDRADGGCGVRQISLAGVWARSPCKGVRQDLLATLGNPRDKVVKLVHPASRESILSRRNRCFCDFTMKCIFLHRVNRQI